MSASANITVGKERTVSKRRTSAWSSQRGPKPATSPSTSPIASATPIATSETSSAICPPTSTREKMSRPSWSVPSRWSALGGSSFARMSIRLGS